MFLSFIFSFPVSEGVHCLRGKRKWRREGLSPCLSPKRQRTNHRPEEKAAAGSGPSAQISQDILGHTPRRLVCRSRLSRTRRRKQQQERESPSVASSVTLNQWDTAGKNTEDITRQFHGQGERMPVWLYCHTVNCDVTRSFALFFSQKSSGKKVSCGPKNTNLSTPLKLWAILQEWRNCTRKQLF